MSQIKRLIPVGVFLVLVASIAIGSGIPPSGDIVVRETPPDDVSPSPGVTGDMPVRLTPLRVRFTGAGAGDPAAVMDRDTRTTFSASGTFTLIFDLEQPQMVAGLRVFGRPDATLSVACASGDAWIAVPGLQGMRTSVLAPGWSDLTATTPCATSSVRVDVAPAAGAALLPEIEIWGAGTPVVPASPQALRVLSEPSLPWSLRSFDADLLETTVEGSEVTARIEIPRAIAQARRAYLLYDLRGLATWRGVPRRVNGRPTLGGVLETPSLDWSPQIERINPEWLREGTNEIVFLPIDGTAPYAVRDVRLLVELDTGANSVELATTPELLDASRGVSPAVDGELTTSWTPFPTGASPGTRSSLTLSFDRAVEPASLGLLLKSIPSGSIQIQAIGDTGGVRTLAARSGATLRAGWNVIPLDPGASATRLAIVLEAGASGSWEPLEIVPLGSGVGGRAEPPSLTIVWPFQGEFSGREAVIRGFVTPDPSGLPVRVTIGPLVLETTDGAFGTIVSKDDVGFFDDEDEAPWSVGLQAVYASGRTLTRTVRLTQSSEGPHSIEGQLLGARTFSVQPGQGKKIRHDGAELDLEAGSVDRPKDLKITPLRDEDLPALDPGMTNVTKGPRRGYRFEPHGTRFAKQIRMAIPYDPSLLPNGMTENDVRTFYFDDQAGRWVALDRVTADAAAQSVVSLTDHFTDMINATLSLPDHPEPFNEDPTTFGKVKPAEPGDRITLIEPPKASSNGEAHVSYRFDLPPGRRGMRPDLAISYASADGNGWLGVGWNLAPESVAVDTRWGVPRFDAGYETETYTLRGEQMTPLAHREALVARAAEKTFHLRREGAFERIVRHGDGPQTYTWEATDKFGVTSIFGGSSETVLADDQGRIVRWFLSEKRDLHGNGIHYTYARVDDTGLPAGTVPGRQLYLAGIDYTTFAGSAGAYQVRFVRDAELGEPKRPDVQIDARGGFKAVTSQLLRRVELSFLGAPVRSWELRYARGAFEKTLLESITQRGADGSELATHRFTYHDDVRTAGGYLGFAPVETWNTGSDDVRSTAIDAIASIAGSDAGRATALSGYETVHAGGHLYVGFNPTSPTKTGSIGGKVGFTGTVSSDALLALIDLNGDGLPDKVFKTSSGVSFRMNRSGPHGTTVFGPAVAVDTLPAIGRETSTTVSLGFESYVGGVSVVANEATSISTGRIYVSDVNGDGLPDLVDGGNILFNHLDANGVPTFDANSATSPVPVGPGTVDGGMAPDYGPQEDLIRGASPLHDTLRRWVAPYPGQVAVTGDVTLVAPASPSAADDGVRVAIQHAGTELWSQTIAAGDATAYTPTGVDAIDVAKGDAIYFRVQSGVEGSHDVVTWDPEIVYVGAPSQLDVNNLNPWRAKASEDFVLAGRPKIDVKMPFTGRVRLVGDVEKLGTTTDDVQLLVLRQGIPVHSDVLNWDDAGTMPTGVAFDVQQDDVVQLRVKVDSPIDLRQIQWTPSMFYLAPPDAPALPSHTVDGTTVTIDRVVDEDGNPLIQLHPPYDIDFYPEDGLTAPQTPWVADDDDTVTVSSHLVAEPGATGIVFMTAKRRGELVAKRTIFIVNGVVQNKQVDIDVEDGDEIFFDYSCYDYKLAEKVGHRVIEVDGDSVPSAFHTTSQQGVFPLGYRGWSVAGYNGNAPRDAQPIVESDLTSDFTDESAVDPRTSNAFLFSPFPEGAIWRGPEDETFVAAASAGSSRLGTNSSPIPDLSSPGSAPPRLGSSSQTAASVGLSILSGSASDGGGGSDLDFLDMNGDQFPDVVGRDRIQYSPALGGLESASRAVAGFEVPRASEATAGTVGVGGSPASFTMGSRGHVDSPGRGAAQKENDTGSQMVSLGLSGSLGSGTSSVPGELADVNGDGLPDRLTLLPSGQLRVAFNLGYAFAPAELWGLSALNEGSSSSASIGPNLGFNGGIYDYAGGVSLGANGSEVTTTLADINGDGLVDRLRRDGDTLRVGLNKGNGFLDDVTWGGAPQGAFAKSSDASVGGGAYFTIGIGPVCFVGCYVILNPGVDASTSLARQEAALIDVDGDGDVDHVSSDDDSELVVARNTTGRTNLLKSILRPMGASIDIDYARDGNTPDVPQSHWVLSRVAISDGLPGDGVDTQLATIRYEGGVWDRLEREFLGFGRVVEEARDVNQGEAVIRRITRDFRTDTVYARGLLLRERLEDGAGRPFLETENTFELRDVATNAPIPDPKSTTATVFPALVRTDRRFFEGQAAPGKATFSTQEFDGAGNVVRMVDAGEPGPADDVEATVAYGSCAASHVLGIPVALTVRENGTELRRRAGVLDCATGEITRTTEYLANGTGAETVLDRDAYGNLVRLLAPPNRNGQRYELRYELDPTVQTYVTRITDSFGYTSTTMFDLALGAKTGTRDLNGQRTSFAYDVHGRMTTMRGPYDQGSGPPTVAFEYHPDAAVPWSLTRHLDTYRNPADPIDTVRFVDGFGRAVQEKNDATVSGANVMIVSGRIAFDALGRPTDRWHPTVEPLGTPGVFRSTYDTVAPTHTDIDVQDRPTKVASPDGTFVTNVYGFGADRDGSTKFEKRATDENGVPTFRYSNLRDLDTGVKQINGAQEIWTSYAHDGLKRLVRITDDRGNITRIVFDNLNRKVSVDSPDEGRTDDVYDLAGNRTARVTANLRAEGREIRYEYDFTRLARVLYPDFPDNNVTYTYGGPGAPLNRAGRKATIIDASGIRERSYGKLGEVISETRTITATVPPGPFVYRTDSVYDTFNRLQQLVYPDGERLTFAYDAGGRLRAISGVKSGTTYEYVRRLEYDKFGERSFVETGNGARTTYAYRPDNRRLQNMIGVTPTGASFLNLTYAYDPAGNVLALTNAVPVATGSTFGGPTQQTFVYDDLDRLTQSSGTYEYAPNKRNNYAVSFDYDTINNMTSRNQVHEIVQPGGSTVRQGKTSYAFTFAYGGGQPHAATHIGDRTFLYDANGNQAGWDNDLNGTRRRIVWDEENRMRSLFDNGQELRYLYDDEGERVVKRGPQGETVYVNAWFTVRNGTIGTKHVWAGPTRVASKLLKTQALEKDRYFYHEGHTGDVSYVTDADGRLYEHLEYFPFGETWVQESTNTQRTPYAFTAKELDEESGLYYFGARYLDPRLGSFNSGEPLLFAKPENGRDNPKFLSVYSYAHQNPGRFVDPDGRDVIIAVGRADHGPAAKLLTAGYPAAARSLQADLAKQGIKATIVMLPGENSQTTARDVIAKAADGIVGGGGKVNGLVYIGHGETDGKRLLPRINEQLKVKDAVEAAKLGPGGAFVAYGCHVSTGTDIDELRKNGVHVYATQRYTWTTAGGQVAVGDEKGPDNNKYGRLKDLDALQEVTAVVDPSQAGLKKPGEKDPTIEDYLKAAEGKKNGSE